MLQSSGSSGPRHKLHNHFKFKGSQTIEIPPQEINGKDVDIIIMDCGIDAAHYDFLDDSGQTRVQMVNWNYLAANPDTLFDDWRTHDVTMREIHETIESNFNRLKLAGKTYTTTVNARKWYTHGHEPGSGNVNNHLGTSCGFFGSNGSFDGVDRSYCLPYLPSNLHGMTMASNAAGRNSCASAANIYSLGNVFANIAGGTFQHGALPQEIIYLFHRCKIRSGITRPTIIVNSTSGDNPSTDVADMYFDKDDDGNYQTDTPNINSTLTSSVFTVTKTVADSTTGGKEYDIRPKFDQSGILKYWAERGTINEYTGGTLSGADKSMQDVVKDFKYVNNYMERMGYRYNHYRDGNTQKPWKTLSSTKRWTSSVKNNYDLFKGRITNIEDVNDTRFWWIKKAQDIGVIYIISAGNSGVYIDNIDDILNHPDVVGCNKGIDPSDPNYGPWITRQYDVYYGTDHGALSGTLSGSIAYDESLGLSPDPTGHILHGGVQSGMGLNPDIIIVGGCTTVHDIDPHAVPGWINSSTFADVALNDSVTTSTFALRKSAPGNPTFDANPGSMALSQRDPQKVNCGLVVDYGNGNFNTSFTDKIEIPTKGFSSSLQTYEARCPTSVYGPRINVWASMDTKMAAEYRCKEDFITLKSAFPELLPLYNPSATRQYEYYGFPEQEQKTFANKQYIQPWSTETAPDPNDPTFFMPSDIRYVYGIDDRELLNASPNNVLGAINDKAPNQKIGTSFAAPAVAAPLACLGQIMPNMNTKTAQQYIKKFSYRNTLVDVKPGAAGRNWPSLWENDQARWSGLCIFENTPFDRISTLIPGATGLQLYMNYAFPRFNFRHTHQITATTLGRMTSQAGGLAVGPASFEQGTLAETQLSLWKSLIWDRLDPKRSCYSLDGSPNLRLHNFFSGKPLSDFASSTQSKFDVSVSGSIDIGVGLTDLDSAADILAARNSANPVVLGEDQILPDIFTPSYTEE